jgi:hypothetical protein
VESKLVRSLAARLDASLAGWLTEVRMRGSFAAQAQHVSGPGGRSTSGEVRPTKLGLTRQGVDIELDPVEGVIAFGPEGGRIEGLTAKADGWTLGADATWTSGAAWRLDATIALQSSGLPASLRAALPGQAGEAFDAVGLVVGGSLSMPGAALSVAPRPGGGLGVGFEGTVAFAEVRIDPAMPIVIDAGRAAIRATGEPGTPSLVEVAFEGDALSLAGVRMAGARAQLATSADGGITIGGISADVHGGALAAQAVIGAPTSGSGRARPGRPWELRAELSDVRFGDLMDNLRATERAPSASESAQSTPAWRGLMDASLTLSGHAGDVGSRVGRGSLRVQGTPDRPAEVIRLPGMMPLLRLSNFQLPMGERLDFAHSEFHVRGDLLVFDELSVRSRSLAIEGYGAMRLPELDLALRFNSRSLSRVALLSDLFEGVRNELVTTTVTGTAYDPRFEFEQLSRTRDLIAELMQRPPRGRPRPTPVPMPTSP